MARDIDTIELIVDGQPQEVKLYLDNFYAIDATLNPDSANPVQNKAIVAALDLKVDKETGKGLSTNDFTTAEKNKLAGIAAGAEVNVQANWNEADQTADSFIQNKPAIPTKTSDLTNDSEFVTDADMQSALDQKVDKIPGKQLSTEDFTSAEKTKLAGIEAGAQVNTITGVKGDAEAEYRTGDVNITKANIGLGNVDNTADQDKPISTAVQTALDLKQDTLTFDSTPTAGSTNPVTSSGIASEISDLNDALSTKVSSVNTVTPDTNGNVSLLAEDIPAEGIGYKYAEGNPVVITDGIAEIADDLKVDFGPIQDLHGYDYPWVGGAGKNKLQVTGTSATTGGVTFTVNSDGTVTANGTATGSVSFDYTYITNLNGDYILNGCPAGASSTTYRIRFRINGGAWIYMNTENVERTFTLTSTDALEISINVLSGVTLNDVVFKAMLRLASETDATFEPYTNICPISGRTQVEVTNKDSSDTVIDSITVQLGQTVYGGTLNVTTGELTVDRAMVDLGTFDWERSTAVSHIFRDDTIPNLAVPPSTELPNAICSAFKAMGFSAISASDNGCFAIGYVLASRLVIVDHRFSNVEDFKAAMSGVQLCYELATPQTIQLTPTQLQLLEGYNILTTDGDNLKLTYLGSDASNVQRVLDNTFKSLAPVEQGIATSAHAVGSYISFNTQFCKVTQAISVGEIVQIGRNIELTTVADELMAILAQISA